MHVIGEDNYHEAVDAVRDILMTYVNLANEAGFGHNADVYVRFDPFRFVDAEIEDAGTHYVDLDLLRSGSAVAILCALYNIWIEEQELKGHPFTKRFEGAVAEDCFNRFPDIQAVITEAISRNSAPSEDLWIEDALAPVYRKYVLGFFAKLAQQDRSAKNG